MIIKGGYNEKPTTIRIATQANGSIELWIEETGKKDDKGETLSYLTPGELLELYKEVKIAGKELFD